ncbi:MAG: response regulator [Treponema sp.]|nr:response regulator [Treponema sp.]
MSQLLIQIISGVNVIISIFILLVIMANWGQPNMVYLGFLAMLVSVDVIGYYLEVTAETLEAALVAYKIQYCSGTFIGPCVSLLAVAYAGRPIRKLPVRIAMFVIPAAVAALVFIDPARYVSDIAFVPTGETLRLTFTPGVLYFINFLYVFGFTLFSNIFTIAHFIRTNRKGSIHSVIFIGTVLLPILCKILWWMGFFPEFDFFYVAITCMIIVLYWYLMRFSQLEWVHLGQDAIIEHLTDAVMTVNAGQQIINANAAFFHFFPDFSCTKGRTTLTEFLGYLKSRTASPLSPALLDGSSPAPRNGVEFSVIPGTGEGETGKQRTFNLTWRNIYAKKKLLGQMIILSDVTAYLTMIKEIVNLKQRAEEASQAKSEFLATVSHEIRTPLNAIIGISEIQLQYEIQNAEIQNAEIQNAGIQSAGIQSAAGGNTRTNMEKIYSSGVELLNIINDILDISKIEAGSLELIPAPYSVPSLINDTVQLNVIRIGSKRIEFKLDIDESIPIKLVGDEKRVRQILNNLLSNAFKYTQAGTVRLWIRWTPGPGEKEGRVTFAVRDTGQGIKREDLGKLFAQYGQLNARANRNIEGTGLGLSITKNLVELMAGTITVESEFGRGSTFTVTLRQELTDPAPIGKKIAGSLSNFQFAEARFERGKNRSRKQYPGGRALVVDDVETNLYVARGLLQPCGITVDCVKSGREAIAAVFSNTRYHIIFMDHMMPGMDGIEAARIIRERRDEYTEALPIIALTANAIIGMEEMFLENGFNGYLSKPIVWSRLDGILAKWMPAPAVFQAPPLAAGSAIPPIAGVNTARGLAITGGSPRVYRGVLDLYCKTASARLAVLRETPQQEHLPDLTALLHGIKSASAGIGAEGIRARAAELAAAANRGDRAFISRNIADFARSLDALAARIQEALR